MIQTRNGLMASASAQIAHASLEATKFPFLSLPPELRKKVYFHLLHSDHPVHPDATGTQDLYRSTNVYRSYFNTGCALIQTCKLIAAEATTVLYRSNIFKFSDLPYTPNDGLVVLDCDIMGMYIFLRLIGPSNRTKIRHMIVKLTYTVADRIKLIEGKEYDRVGMPRYGRPFSKVLELLRWGHGLDIFELDGVRWWTWKEYKEFFTDRKSNVIQLMSKIKDLKALECSDPELLGHDAQRKGSEEDRVAKETVRWLRKEMTAPKVEVLETRPQDSAAVVHTPAGPPKLTVRVTLLEQERKELARVVGVVVTRLENVEKELEQVGGTVRAITEMI